MSHAHGTTTAYTAGRCRCDACRTAATRAKKRYLAGISSYVPVQAAQQHLARLRTAGMSCRELAEATGLSRGALYNIATGKVRLVRVSSVRALAAVHDKVGGRRGLVDATGVRRRVQALQALGYPLTTLAHHIGWHPTNMGRLLDADTVTAATRKTVNDLYDRLSMTIPADSIPVRRAKAKAARRGWVPPLAWDDDTIDDPAARPDVGVKSKRSLALWEDSEELIRLEGLTVEQAAERLGITRTNLMNARLRTQAKLAEVAS